MNKIIISEVKMQVINLLSTLGLEPIHEYEHLGSSIIEDSAELAYEVADNKIMLYITEQQIEIHNGNNDVKVFIGKTRFQRVKEYFEILSKVSK